MQYKNPKKLLESKHLPFILECLDKEYTLPQIQSLLSERGMNVSIPTLSKLKAKYQAEGKNVLVMNQELHKTANLVSEQVKKIPGLSTLVDRRNFIIDSIMDRRKKLLEFMEEQNRAKEVREYVKRVISAIDDEGDVLKAKQILQALDSYVDKNFSNGKPNPHIESLIRQYTMDLHDIFKYVEDWTKKQELDTLIDTVCKQITQAAINSFGQYLKTDNSQMRETCINNFVNSVNKIMQQSKEQTLNADKQ